MDDLVTQFSLIVWKSSISWIQGDVGAGLRDRCVTRNRSIDTLLAVRDATVWQSGATKECMQHTTMINNGKGMNVTNIQRVNSYVLCKYVR